MKNDVSWNKRNVISLIVFTILVFFLIFPWNTKIYLPSIIEAKQLSNLYTPKNSYIEKIIIKNAQEVKKDEILMVLKSDDLEYAISNANKELELLKYDLNNIAVNETNLENRFIIHENILKKEQELNGLLKSKNELIIKAPFDGTVYFKDTFKINQWVNPKEAIINIYNSNTTRLVAYCKDTQIDLIKKEAKGKFIANNGELKTLNIKINNISHISLTSIEYKELSSLYKGKIATRESNNKNKTDLITEEAYFKIEGEIVDKKFDYKTRIDGELIIEVENKSILKRFLYTVYNILIKESSF